MSYGYARAERDGAIEILDQNKLNDLNVDKAQQNSIAMFSNNSTDRIQNFLILVKESTTLQKTIFSI